MTIRKPGLFFRALVLGAQGVFYNLFCKISPAFPAVSPIHHATISVLSYLVSPKTCHRFVGHLEEEAVLT